MNRINTVEELKKIREFAENALEKQKKKVLICAGTGCVAGGSLKIYDKIKKTLRGKRP